MADLTKDFPGFDALAAADITTTEQVEGMSREELLAVDGIGPATADKIIAELNGTVTAPPVADSPADGPPPADTAPEPVRQEWKTVEGDNGTVTATAG